MSAQNMLATSTLACVGGTAPAQSGTCGPGTALNVNCCCPGYCRTDMASNRGPRPPEVGARNAVMLAEPECSLNGEFIQDERVSEW